MAYMPQYLYRAKNRDGQAVEGVIEADSEAAVVNRLVQGGVYPFMLSDASVAQPQRAVVRSRVPGRQLAYVTRQLADLLGGGLSLFKALSLLSEQTEHRRLREAIGEVGHAVRGGQAFSDALSRHPDAFSPLYVSMIRAGEAGGDLDAVLVRLADLFDGESELRGRIVSAMVYPCVVLIIGIATIAVLLTYVVPKLTALFEETGQMLPLPTRMLMGISATLSGWWWLWLGLSAAAAWGARVFHRSSGGRAAIDRSVIRLPVVGSLIRKIQTARFTRNLGVMAGQGVPVLQALEVSSSAISNGELRRAVAHVQDAVRQGEHLARALAASRQFPAFVSNMVAVGEESGTLETALLNIASSYEREADRALRMFTTALEPLLIVAVGLVVMGIVISMLLPIFQLGMVTQ